MEQEPKQDAILPKHLMMTSPKGNSESYFPETLNVHRGEAEGNVEVEGNSLYLSTQKQKKGLRRNCLP